MDIRKIADSIINETEKIIVGKTDCIKLIIMAILSGGHVLLDDVPGVGKTTLVKTISKALGCDSGRIQFVPDMLPSDIIGMQIFNQKTGDFELRQGPIITNILLADEINRAIPRTQSALLEAMEEHQISIDREKIQLPNPFIVLATQNPVESESTFRLPAAQMDRFMVRLSIGYPKQKEELAMLKNLGDTIPFDSVKAITSPEEIMSMQSEIAKVILSDEVAEYIIAICEASRNNNDIKIGASPRASRALYKASKAWAAMHGRTYVIPDDVKYLAKPVLAHRLVLNSNAAFSNKNEFSVLDEILNMLSAAPSLEKTANEL